MGEASQSIVAGVGTCVDTDGSNDRRNRARHVILRQS